MSVLNIYKGVSIKIGLEFEGEYNHGLILSIRSTKDQREVAETG